MLDVKPRIIFTFFTTTQAMAFEESAHAAGLPGRLIPVPGTLRAGCGLCWAAPLEARAQLEAFITQNGLTVEGIFKREL